MFEWARGVTHFKWDSPSRVETRVDRQRARERHWREVCRVVDRRDGARCRACRRACDPFTPDLLHRAHRHHLRFLSLGGEDSTECVLLLCARCHDDVHRHRLRIEAQTPYGADGALAFFRTTDGEEYLSRRERAPGIPERG